MKNDEFQKFLEVLKQKLTLAEKTAPELDKCIANRLDIVVNKSESSKGVLAVLVTSLVKKVVDPSQDIRYHQQGLTGGYSGRVLDTNVVTPFLRSNHFPAMAESGWLTRSLEQKTPYTLSYQGAITPKALKNAFLQTLDDIEEKRLDPSSALIYIFSKLISMRNDRQIKMAKPVGLSIEDIIELLHKHFNYPYGSHGASRLPVLAVYAVYKVMMKEVERYKGLTLSPLFRHNAADSQTQNIGDIQVRDESNHIIEAVEIKHGIPITSDMINKAFESFRTEPIKRYYLLTTYYDNSHTSEISEAITEIQKKTGCQVIANGVESTLKYYLRLLRNTDLYITAYAELLESDKDILFEQREAWNKITTL